VNSTDSDGGGESTAVFENGSNRAEK